MHGTDVGWTRRKIARTCVCVCADVLFVYLCRSVEAVLAWAAWTSAYTWTLWRLDEGCWVCLRVCVHLCVCGAVFESEEEKGASICPGDTDVMCACRIGDEGERLQQLWIVCRKLPTANMDNLKLVWTWILFFNFLASTLLFVVLTMCNQQLSSFLSPAFCTLSPSPPLSLSFFLPCLFCLWAFCLCPGFWCTFSMTCQNTMSRQRWTQTTWPLWLGQIYYGQNQKPGITCQF